MQGSCHIQGVEIGVKYHSRALKSHFKFKASTGLRAAFQSFLLHKISTLFNLTFGDEVLTLAKRSGSY